MYFIGLWLQSKIQTRYQKFTFIGIHLLVILLWLVLYPSGMFDAETPYDDVYFPYILYPGTFSYLYIGRAVNYVFWPGLTQWFSYHMASVLCIIILPGLLCGFLGIPIWYGIGCLVQQKLRNQRQRADLTPENSQAK